MEKHAHKSIFASLVAILTLLAGTQAAWSRDDNNSEGLANFNLVTDFLYRGAQPSSAGFKTLQQMGVSMIVNFRDEADQRADEQREVESLGMKYVGIPWRGSDEPSNAQVVQFLDLIRANPQAKIFVHCQRGADRTGVMVAAYRIAVEHKSVADAVAEMYKFHYSHFFLPHLQRYVDSLPNLLQSNALFSAYAPVPATAPGSIPGVVATVAAHSVTTAVPVTP